MDPFWILRRYCSSEGWKFASNLKILDDYSKVVIENRKLDENLDQRGDLISLFINNKEFSF